MNLTQKIERLIKPSIEKMGYKLLKIEWNNGELRLIVDREEGNIDVQECARISREVSEILDKKDWIRKKYYLVVSSPGSSEN